MFPDFPGHPVVKNPPSRAEDLGSIPGRATKIRIYKPWSKAGTPQELSPGSLEPAGHNEEAAHRN